MLIVNLGKDATYFFAACKSVLVKLDSCAELCLWFSERTPNLTNHYYQVTDLRERIVQLTGHASHEQQVCWEQLHGI